MKEKLKQGRHQQSYLSDQYFGKEQRIKDFRIGIEVQTEVIRGVTGAVSVE